MTNTRLWPDIAIPPGELLAETLESLGMSQADLARRTGRPVQAINEIVRGAKEITPETALQLERVLGVPAHIWTRLEADYRYNRVRLKDAKHLEDEVPLAEKYPYKEMAQHGWVSPTKDPVAMVQELLRFFRVSSLRHLETRELSVVWRKSAKVTISREALLAWLAKGEREAEEQNITAPFDRDQLQRRIPELRRATRDDPQGFEPRIRSLFAECGVALAFVPHLKRTGAHGATQWLGSRALVQLSVRYRWSDIFWFSLFHEVGHLLLHHRKGIFVNPEGAEKSFEERAADDFAQDTLIRSDRYLQFVRSCFGRPSADAVERLARELDIAPSIVVGRLQYEKVLPPTHLNQLRPRFELVRR
jgi:HTH-type transcriptional regulator / antitoxin HigA